MEAGRTARHTLDEHHEHLLSTSFEGNSFLGIDASSSQLGQGAGFGSFTYGDDDAFLGENDVGLGFDLGLGDDLAMELGEGWGGAGNTKQVFPLRIILPRIPSSYILANSPAMNVDDPNDPGMMDFDVAGNEDPFMDIDNNLPALADGDAPSHRKTPASRGKKRVGYSVSVFG